MKESFTDYIINSLIWPGQSPNPNEDLQSLRQQSLCVLNKTKPPSH